MEQNKKLNRQLELLSSRRPTQHAPDWRDSAAFSGFFLRPSGILLPSRIHVRLPAVNANRWAAEQ
jgi:hypothetical protein